MMTDKSIFLTLYTETVITQWAVLSDDVIVFVNPVLPQSRIKASLIIRRNSTEVRQLTWSSLINAALHHVTKDANMYLGLITGRRHDSTNRIGVCFLVCIYQKAF
jgi:hypothetical protein